MKSVATIGFIAISFSFATAAAHAADEFSIERLATCQDSWLDWKDDQARMEKFANSLHASYVEKEDGYLAPKSPKTLFGMPVARVYPDTVGMGVGFSVLVNSSFSATKKTIEKTLGKPLKCESDSDEMQGCQFERGPKKTVMVASDTDGSKSTLVGCFYFYEK